MKRLRLWQVIHSRLLRRNIGHGNVVEVFSKPDCHLCEVAKAHLQRLQKKWGFELREVNIADDESLFIKYGDRIPLVWVNGQLTCKFKIDERALRQKMRGTRRAVREE